MRWFYLLVLLTFLISCDNNDDIDCTNAIPPASNFLLKFEDQAGNSLIGTTYVQDSFKLYNPNSTVYLKPYNSGPSDQLVVWMPDINSGETYFLELDATDTDTLIINHSEMSDDCFTYSVLDSFIYNNEVLYDENSSFFNELFTIIKE